MADQIQDSPLAQGGSMAGAPLALTLLVSATAFMQLLDASIISPAIPAMAQYFDTQSVNLNIGISAYLLTVGVFIPISGWLARRYGTRAVFISAIGIFTVASALCGLSQTLEEFVAARVLQGIGGAMMVPIGRLVLLHLTPKDKLIHVMSIMVWPALVAPVLGPPLGGFISEHFSWTWIFYLNVPLGLIALLIALRLVPNAAVGAAQPFDMRGFVTVGIALFCLLFAAEALGQAVAQPWQVAALAATGAVLLTFGWRHLRRAEHPLVALDALKAQTFRANFRGGAFFRMGMNAVPFLIPILYQDVFGWSSFEAGLILMAMFAGNLGIKPITTPLIRRVGFRPVLVVNGVLNVLSIAALALIGPGMPVWVMVVLLVLSGASRSTQFTATNTMAFADIDDRDMSDANTLSAAGQQLAMGLGIAVGAIGWRVGQMIFPQAAAVHGVLPYHAAFLFVAAITALGLIDMLRLPPDAGETVSKGVKPDARAATA